MTTQDILNAVEGYVAERIADLTKECDALVKQYANLEGIATERGALIQALQDQVKDLNAQIDKLKQGQSVPPPVTDPGFLPGWGNPVWRDEFDTPGINPDRWNARNDTTVSYDQAVIYAANSSIPGDGFLHQKIERLATPVNRSGRMRYFSTGYLDTNGKFAQRYGRWEVRARLPLTPGASRGFWPAFWLRDAQGSGECDVFEAYGSPSVQPRLQPGAMVMTLHQDTNHAAGTVKRECRPDTSIVRVDDGQFHTFAVEWTPAGFQWFVDGVARFALSVVVNPWIATSFPSGLHMRLNCQAGSSWAGYYDPTKPTEAVTPAEMTVDYVRVWKYTG